MVSYRIPLIGMASPLFFRVISVLLFLVILSVARPQSPSIVAVKNLPEDFRHCFGVTQLGETWVGVSSAGLLLGLGQQDSLAALTRPPGGGIIRLAVPHQNGLLVAGQGQAFLYSNGTWRDLHIADQFWSATPTLDSTLLVGQKGLYRIGSDGAVERLYTFTGPRAANVLPIRGVPHIFSAADGVYRWKERSLQRVDELLPWAAGTHVTSIQEINEDTLFAVTGRGGWLIQNGVATPVCPGIWKDAVKNLLLDATIYGEIVVVSTFYGGVKAYSIHNEQLRWQIDNADFGGNLYSATRFPEGLVIGSAEGVFMLPDPRQLVYSKIPEGDIRFIYNDPKGILLGLTTGVVPLGSVEPSYPANVYSMTRTPNGTTVLGLFGGIQFGERNLAIGGRDVFAIVALNNDTVAACQLNGVSIVTANGEKHELKIDSPTSTIARTPAGDIVAGTSSGARVLANNGKEIARFGNGATRVFQLGNRAAVFDGNGNLFWEDGQRIAHLPFSNTIDAALWDGKICVLGRFDNGEPWLGAIDTDSSSWKPYDAPIPTKAGAIGVIGDKLTVLAPGLLLQLLQPSYLAKPTLGGVRVNGARDISQNGNFKLAAEQQSLDLHFPRPRLFPWRSPSYVVHLENEEPQHVRPGGILRLPRLGWGNTKVNVEARWAHLASTSEIRVFRARPWWARTPGFVLYATAIGVVGYGSIRFRTRALEKRALRLQAMVDERTAELRQAQKAREEFFSTLSHEIRNPLNGVVGICEILEEASTQAIAPRERVFVRTLRGCADQLRSILDDVLDFARIDRGEIQVHEEPFELLTAVEGAARAADANLGRCTLELPNSAVWIRGDVGKVRQIVTNLVSNALKYGVPQEAHIKTAVTEEGPDLLKVRIAVANTGNTIPPEELERIFTGFVRGSDAVKRRIAGSGIGLAVSRRMAKALGGDLLATSENGLTEFALELTFQPTAPEVELEPAILTEKTSRALAIEDEQYNRLVLGHILARLGYEVDWAADGATAMERVRSGTYDLILTDFVLPDTNGVELAKKILAELKDPKPPIVAVTAYSTPDKIQQAREAGISGFVTKPISKKKLEAAILGVAPKVRIRQALDLDDAELCDFSALLRVQNGRQLLAQYADELPGAWSNVVTALAVNPWGDRAEALSRMVHGFKSRILAVHAENAAEQLTLLESAVKDDQRADADRLIGVIAPMIIDITEAARRRALG
jgi:signal transduction histidine kinase/CheY-like chemotaxis protein